MKKTEKTQQQKTATKSRKRTLTKKTASHEEVSRQDAFTAPPSDRIVYLTGSVTEELISQVCMAIIHFANMDKTAPITLVISTYGGSVDEMNGLYDVIKHVKCPVYTVGLGKIMSAGILLLASGTKGSRLVGANTTLMIHAVASDAGGNIFDIKREVKLLEKYQSKMTSLLEKETTMSKEKIEEIMNLGHDFYFTAEEAVQFGLADAIIGEK